MTDDHKTRPTDADLERHKQNARSKRLLAWELLKQTRNPEYVALRYGYPVETMRKALEKIPSPNAGPFRRSATGEAIHRTLKRARDVLPENLRAPATSESKSSREPGEDDDLE